jgi:hypothetical protein
MIRAFDSGRELVNRGLGDRHWGNAQAEELRRLLSSMSRAQADELTGELLAAINSGSLQVDVTGAPF